MTWVKCAKCGHKLFRVDEESSTLATIYIEAKCSSCKALNDVSFWGPGNCKEINLIDVKEIKA